MWYLRAINAVIPSDADDVIKRQTWRPRQPTSVSKRRDMSPKIGPSGGSAVSSSVTDPL